MITRGTYTCLKNKITRRGVINTKTCRGEATDGSRNRTEPLVTGRAVRLCGLPRHEQTAVAGAFDSLSTSGLGAALILLLVLSGLPNNNSTTDRRRERLCWHIHRRRPSRILESQSIDYPTALPIRIPLVAVHNARVRSPAAAAATVLGYP